MDSYLLQPHKSAKIMKAYVNVFAAVRNVAVEEVNNGSILV